MAGDRRVWAAHGEGLPGLQADRVPHYLLKPDICLPETFPRPPCYSCAFPVLDLHHPRCALTLWMMTVMVSPVTEIVKPPRATWGNTADPMAATFRDTRNAFYVEEK